MTASFRIIRLHSVERAAECQLCGALVAYNAPATNAHTEWHRTLAGWQNAIDKALDPAPFPFQCAICFGPVDVDGDTCGTCADLANEGVL